MTSANWSVLAASQCGLSCDQLIDLLLLGRAERNISGSRTDKAARIGKGCPLACAVTAIAVVGKDRIALEP